MSCYNVRGAKKLKALNVYIKIQNMFGSTEVQVDGENKKLWINSKEIKKKSILYIQIIH